MSLTIDIMVPVKPMLARVSKSCADTVSRCPNGMLAEIKYDGERIQIHKNGDQYSCFSRNLKPVTPHKVFISFLDLAFFLLMRDELFVVSHSFIHSFTHFFFLLLLIYIYVIRWKE